MSARALLGAVLLAALIGPPARGQADGEPPPPPPEERPAPPDPEKQPTPAAQGLTQRPELIHKAVPTYPPEAWEQDIEGDVVLLLWVNEEGLPEAAEVLSTPGHGLETAALVAAKKLRFSPAEVDGQPVKVKIRYTFRFRKPEKGIVAQPPPAAADCPKDPRPPGRLVARVRQRGTGRPLPNAEVYLLDLDQAILTDADGRFDKELAPGGYALTIRIPGHWAFEELTRIEPGERVEVEYFVEPRRRGKYRTIVWGSEGKALVGRTTLSDAEIYEIPGTMGDPMRVVMLMPGVTSSISGLSSPVIRGSLPGDTRFEIDGVQVPMLYHMLLGTAVVNPRFTAGIDFQPSGYSVEHGHFSGALINAPAAERPTERVTAFDVSIIQANVYHAQPITDDLQVVAAARYGTLGLVIEAVAADTVFRFWDYQLKTFYRAGPADELELVAFGAGNEFGEKKKGEPADTLVLGFHRALVRWRHHLTGGWLQLGLEFGWEGFEWPEDDEEDDGDGAADEEPPPDSTYTHLALKAKAVFGLGDALELRLGGEARYHDFGFELTDGDGLTPSHGLTTGLWAEVALTPGDWTILPGVRLSSYSFGFSDHGARQVSLEPRLGLGYQITDWLSAKASAGMYAGPPRFTLVAGPIVLGPVPSLFGYGLEYGLTRATRFAAGLEASLPYRFELGLQGYFSLLDSGLDFSLADTNLQSECDLAPCGQLPADDDLPATQGRSYGLELTVRRKLGDRVFGWLNYSLSRSERKVPTAGVLPFAFDQTHVLNAVISVDIGRNWTLGNTFHFHTGRPYTPEQLVSCEIGDGIFEQRICRGKPLSKRLPAFWRIDFRVQKRELFKTWYIDFYMDIFNLTFNKETIGYEFDEGRRKPIKVPIFIPMVGLRGQF